MTYNISKEYIDFTKKNIFYYFRLFMGKKFNKEIFVILLDIYINVRYYNLYENKYKNFELNINYYLKNKALELIGLEEYKDINDIIDITYLLFKYILYLDDVKKFDKVKEFVEEIEEFRIKRMDLYDEDFSKELIDLIKLNTKRKSDYLSSVTSDKFKISFRETNNKEVFFADLTHNIAFPLIYSEYSINKVYHSGIINEDVLFITYSMVNKVVLENIICGNFETKYIVDFPISIFEKKEKFNRLLKIIDDDSVRDNVIIKFNYTNYLDNKETIDMLVKQGYKFAIKIDGKFDYTDKSKIWLDIFPYIICSNGNINIFSRDKIIIEK